MHFIDIAKSISEYGISLVLSAICIYVIIKLLKIQFDKLAEANKRKAHDNALALRGEIDEKVYELLNEFIQQHHGLRLHVIEFTNSVTSVAYLPFKYMSCTYEVVSYGTKPEARCIDKLSTSLFSPFLSKLGRSSHLILDGENTHGISGVMHDLYEQIGGRYMLSVMLKSSKDKCIGYVAFYKDNAVNNDDIEDLISVGSKLSTLLGILDK